MCIRTQECLGGLCFPTSDRPALPELPSPQVSWRSVLPGTEISDWPGPGERLKMLRKMLGAPSGALCPYEDPKYSAPEESLEGAVERVTSMRGPHGQGADSHLPEPLLTAWGWEGRAEEGQTRDQRLTPEMWSHS